ncbi:hypothetical protein EDC14_1003139 [Hydrogenispora ethanolica]|uniref:Uncharacterized protein n=2 Tax=Hydrogenispora ethanolica TaxID=1082276 RepID=A0A4V2QGB7_HYDET|nr:hypothetical protein EDC14_1003139 [Hydrogenispora ethanolica]
MAMKFLRPAALAGLLLLLLTAAGPGQCAEQFRLNRQYRPGDHYNMKVYSHYQITQQTPEGTLEMAMVYGYGFDFETLSVDKRRNSVNRIRLHSMLLRLNTPLGTLLDFDSTDPFRRETEENMIYAALIGFGYEVKSNAAGRVTSVKGIKEMLKKLDRTLPDSTKKKEALKNLKEQFNYQSMAGVADNLSLYPAHPVAVGESWQGINRFMASGVLMMSEDRYEILERRDGRVRIGVTSTVKPGLTNGPRNMEIGGRQWGEIEILEANGWVNRLHLRQQISGSPAGSAPDAPGQFQMQGTVILEPFPE